MTEYVLRFLIGGVVVSIFAILGNVLRPKRFAGLFGAVPSVALASLALVLHRHGTNYAATEATAMIAGAIALGLYCVLVCHLLMRARWRALPATTTCLLVWLAVALALLQVGRLMT